MPPTRPNPKKPTSATSLSGAAAPVFLWRLNSRRPGSFFQRTWLQFTATGIGEAAGPRRPGPGNAAERERCFAAFRKALRLRQGFEVEYAWRDPDRTMRWLRDTGVPVRDARGRVTGYAGTTIDLTQRRDGEVRLAESDRRHRQLLKFIDGIFWLGTPDYQPVLVHDDRYEEIFGRSRQAKEADPLDWLQAIHPDDLPRLRRATRDLATGRVRQACDQYRILHADGSIRHIESRSAVIPDAQGRPELIAAFITDITERKRSEDALRKSEERFRQMAEISDDIFWVTTPDFTRLLYESPAYGRISGVSSQRRYRNPQDWFRLILPEDRERVQAAMARVGSGQAPKASIEYRIRRVDGAIRDVLGRAYAIPGPNGRPLKVSGVMTDITDRKIMERALRSSEERFRQMAEINDDLFWVATPDLKRFIYLSPAYGRINGRSRADLERDPTDWIKAVVPTDVPAVLEAIQRLTSGRHAKAAVEFRVVRPDGTVRELLVRAYVVHGPDGEVTEITGTAGDITAQKRTERALRASEERFHLAMQGTNDGLFDWDVPSGRVYFSPRWKSMLGYAEHEIAGEFEEWRRRLHPDDVERAMAYISDYLARSVEPYVLEHRLRHKDGSFRWILARGALVRDARGQALRMVGSHKDITERKELERRIIEVTDRERRSIGHDLHDGLGQQFTALELMSQALVNRLESTTPEALGAAREINRLIRRTITQVRRLSHGLTPIELDASGLADAFQELANSINDAHGPVCTFHGTNPASLPDGDVATHLYRIGQEAANNAVKHSGATRVEIRLEETHGKVQLSIADNGHGFDPRAVEGKGRGLQVMDYRAKIIGANLMIGPTSPVGSRMVCELSLA